MGTALVVVDDFLGNAEALRAAALKLDYSLKGPYPGRNSVEQIPIPGLDDAASAILREPVRAMRPPGSHGHCRLALASDSEPGKIHIDPSHWSGILYLSLDEDSRAGTEFYRHRRTGMESVPKTLEALQAVGFHSYGHLQREVVDKDALDPSEWERTTSISMKFNRLVLLQPQYWHTSGPGFGDSVENGRLIYVMFFRRADEV
ncbi:DUF6445 family protein [Sphingomonas sp. SM33]|uniref:DUF6445 family protein n=1 Tax=Sphingomonas telluris TaxID=2907998 RepID=A0ABS9VP01_9SPHN|nr:DUF6445 family protein [Sphingomonas telluris]MCH8616706.1 DUF6445 family protein [Sphingomonas telluris]